MATAMAEDIVATSKFRPSKHIGLRAQKPQEVADDWDAESDDEGISGEDPFQATKQQWTKA
jgi:hypothetical protein